MFVVIMRSDDLCLFNIKVQLMIKNCHLHFEYFTFHTNSVSLWAF